MITEKKADRLTKTLRNHLSKKYDCSFVKRLLKTKNRETLSMNKRHDSQEDRSIHI